MGARILVTGAGGFVGAATCKAALAAGHDVVAVIRNGASRLAGIADAISIARVDLADTPAVAALLGSTRPDIVVHSAWEGVGGALRSGDIRAAYARGKTIYTRNCMACHGDALSGDGHFAHGFNPTPIDFTDVGTIPQLSESFVFWRIAKGGPGLPREGAPWNSAMPVWEEFLTEEEIWAVVLFLYEQTGARPRSWGE